MQFHRVVNCLSCPSTASWWWDFSTSFSCCCFIYFLLFCYPFLRFLGQGVVSRLFLLGCCLLLNIKLWNKRDENVVLFFLCPQRIGLYSEEKAKDQVIILSFLKQYQTDCQKYYYYCHYYSTISGFFQPLRQMHGSFSEK